MLQDVFPVVWICGMGASGKTTSLNLLRSRLSSEQVDFFNDSEEIVEFVRSDTAQLHHRSPSPGSFVLTDSAAPEASIRSLIRKICQTAKPKIVELSRGLDRDSQVDFSYMNFFAKLPKERQQSDLFVYLFVRSEVRRRRNSLRPALSDEKITAFTSFKCPEEAFDRFFSEDDFFAAAAQRPVNYICVPNLSTKASLEQNIVKLFLKS